MAKALLDQLREHLEDVEHTWVFFAMIMICLFILSGITLFGVYLYTRL